MQIIKIPRRARRVLQTSASKARAWTSAFGAREIGSGVENVLVSEFFKQHGRKMLIAFYAQQKAHRDTSDPFPSFSHFGTKIEQESRKIFSP